MTRRWRTRLPRPARRGAELCPVVEPSAPISWRVWLALAYILEAIAREMLGEHAAADTAL